ncbi:hypothetical protein CpipJ_CPIJ014966 [Culex quinquefasciatus]|uniref:Uncharacterized protein n=1 Tax=Culex quinquefasciatus TaxID=7176 RepID=B0X6V9_CULQU|nr:hypothetical protein CpipJ_CPIJ014966 [Culex quinquefasciatus]|eukprot:XP_001865381.1 hypothetical protein CpipJ_CPIJ014966 [Culex quinquefasciatus]
MCNRCSVGSGVVCSGIKRVSSANELTTKKFPEKIKSGREPWIDGVQLPVTLIEHRPAGGKRHLPSVGDGFQRRVHPSPRASSSGSGACSSGRRLLKNSSLRHRSGEETTNTPEAVPIEKDHLLERLEKIDTSSPSTKTASAKETGDGSSAATNDVDMENHDLIQRLEAS